MKNWKHAWLLLGSVGISSIGNFIYLVSINILVYQMTGSAAAVAGLWLVGPLTNMVMKFWTGSFIDFRSKRKIMITTYLARAALILCIPFATSVAFIYAFLVLLAIANSFFMPSSTTYITQMIPKEDRKRFNSIQSVMTSGAFILGPSIGGGLILLTNIDWTLWMNSSFFIVSAILLAFIPEKEIIDRSSIPKLTFKQVWSDFHVVVEFMKSQKFVAFFYLAFIATMWFTFAMDAQEVVFAQSVVGLSEFDYSLLISITGIGSVVAAILLSIFSKKVSLRFMVGVGVVMTTVGYLLYAFAWSFSSIAFGFIILGFFLVFFNAGIATFYQNNIPTDTMGRVTSIFQLIQSVGQVIFVLGVGVLADLIALRMTIVAMAVGMLVVALMMAIMVFQPKRQSYFQEN
ncbi:MFS transporter [Halalkalibacillus sediminis]|uniref:MFS transporter n=1 Tax=Halalkalibacillus sediminis TaxID=2018042 RepID=UPI001EE3A2E8|nr:MFS transporter [Halalkalibacillus sediminis]